ncbi:MAG TPA: DUF1592 domain-containing protein [Pirellulales bacterium]|nr:DUF1592 domain-containing protein [Pirellulales bacterium]
MATERMVPVAGHSRRVAGIVVAVLVWALAGSRICAAAGETPEDQSAGAAERVRPFLERHCYECHRGQMPKGELRLDRLKADFADADGRKRWRFVLQRVSAGEMPPEEKPRPPKDDAERLTAWIAGRLEAAEAAERALHGRVVFRRLNRAEYENTVRDLLGVNVKLKDLLPLDSSAHGFDNVGEALHVSSFLMDRYLEAAEAALDVAIANRPQPPKINKRYSLTETHQVKHAGESVFRKLEGGGVAMFASSAWQAVTLSPFYPPDRGPYRFRICASAVQSDKPVTYRVDAGLMLMGTKPHLIGYFDAPPGEPGAGKSALVEFIDELEPRNTIRILPYGLAAAQTVNKAGADAYDGPGLAVDWVEVEGPLYDAWPPESHRRIFGDLRQAPAPIYNRRDRVEVVSDDPRADAERVLRRFARRAFRRPVAEADLEPFVRLIEAKLAQGRSFEQAVRAGLTAVMVSPRFLYLDERPGKLDDFALASRLSYFLWSSMPDESLLALAEQGQLSQPEVLHAEVERLLNDPRAAAFTENFVGQWLGLRDIDFTEPSHLLYPEFDEMLKVSMVRETELFFAEVLQQDLSLTNFVASDFSMLNGRLARHYGIPGVEGWEFRKTPLPAGSHRGGLLTMASVLKVTANGTSTSPVMRGAWVLDRILGAPPSPPPPNVSALEPDIRGATTIREQLAKHRQLESCGSCHRRIDPPGFALESFDVIGGWRENYRTTGNGESVVVDGRRMPYHKGRAVDPADILPDGRAFANIDEFKQLLLADQDQIARALATKLLTYATGGAPVAADQAQVDAIIGKILEKNYGFRTLIHEIVASDLFRTK